jgi:hypothetical protein
MMNSSEAGPITIKTDQPNVKVSWQVTGVRQDPFATMQRIVAEEDKPDNERGFYMPLFTQVPKRLPES